MNAVDTNILIYSIDAGDDTKRRKALELIESLPESDTVIPWQAACEIAAVLRKMSACGRFRGNHADAAAAPRASFPIVLPQLSTLERSLHIQTRDRVSAWDSLLIAA